MRRPPRSVALLRHLHVLRLPVPGPDRARVGPAARACGPDLTTGRRSGRSAAASREALLRVLDAMAEDVHGAKADAGREGAADEGCPVEGR